jgi:hypothetical protein
MKFRWVIDGELVRGPRPRNRNKWAGQVSTATVYGIQSVICLLDQNQLRFYEQLPLGLVSYYRQNGLITEHIPVRLQPHIVLDRIQREKLWKAYKRLPKPIIVHCSAGRMRTHKVVLYLKNKLKKKS